MKLNEQRDTLRNQAKETEDRLAYFIHFLRTATKFKGIGEDWIRTGEVWPLLQDLQHDLRFNRHSTLPAAEYQLEMSL